MAEYDSLRSQHEARLRELIGADAARINRPADELRAERDRRLRAVIGAAKEGSPWYRQRLAGVDARTITEANLPSMPTMTKQDLMDNFDDVLTVRRVSRAAIEDHLSHLTDDDYLFDEFHVVASGGSSGMRGVFVYDWDAWATCAMLMQRFRLRYVRSHPELGAQPLRVNVAAGKATHISFAAARTFRGTFNATNVPATLPLKEIIIRLNDLQPVILTGYPSLLYELALRARGGELRIAPRVVGPNSEPLLPEMRRAIEEAWGCAILNAWGASEGVFAGACGEGAGMHLDEDLAIFELVDRDGQPAAAGTRAAKLLITNLYNTVQPLIRYELTDEASSIEAACPCGCAMRRIDDIEGRSDDVFVYGDGTLVHPLVFRSLLGIPAIVEYQVRQTPRGADVAIRTPGEVDAQALCGSIAEQLARAGLDHPSVTVEIVESFDRQTTGKLKRFFPLDS
jgi:phenylacetate-coenzyme A ligase PaaK-like adenylate-forming protein